MIEQYNTVEKVEAGLAELKAMWDALLSKYTVDTPDDKMNRMVNIWNQYQCMVTFNTVSYTHLAKSAPSHGK